ncbi:MAG: 50S ribosomal protein L13 [Actinobacteria bacterium]|nr:50S ribosomal protein L13 [Actinomycetota bacterium]
MKTFSPRPRDIERRWYVVDADGAVLGRLASEVAAVLRGKHKPIFAPHADTGDHVIVVNAGKTRLTGGKEESKIYYRHSGYPGGLREIGYARLLAERPVLAVEKAIRGMLPKNRLGRQIVRKLSVYEGPEHPHQAQQPRALALGEVPPWTGLPEPKPRPTKPADRKPKPATRRKTAGSTPSPAPEGPESGRKPARGRKASAAAPGRKRSTAASETKRRASRPAKKAPVAPESGAAAPETPRPSRGSRKKKES